MGNRKELRKMKAVSLNSFKLLQMLSRICAELDDEEGRETLLNAYHPCKNKCLVTDEHTLISYKIGQSQAVSLSTI